MTRVNRTERSGKGYKDSWVMIMMFCRNLRMSTWRRYWKDPMFSSTTMKLWLRGSHSIATWHSPRKHFFPSRMLLDFPKNHLMRIFFLTCMLLSVVCEFVSEIGLKLLWTVFRLYQERKLDVRLEIVDVYCLLKPMRTAMWLTNEQLLSGKIFDSSISKGCNIVQRYYWAINAPFLTYM